MARVLLFLFVMLGVRTTGWLSRLAPFTRVQQRSLRSPAMNQGTWGRGILLSGILASCRYAGGDATMQGPWIDPARAALRSLRQAVRHPPLDCTQVNSLSLWNACIEADEILGAPDLREEALSRVERFTRGAILRHSSGAMSHLRRPCTVWADTPYMVAPLLARIRVATGNREHGRMAVDQVLSHLDALRDPRTGLVRHSVWPSMPWLEDPFLWARGNGWVLAAATEVLSILGSTEARDLVEPSRRLAEGIVARQGPGGLWPVDLEDPSSPEDSSTAALVAGAIHRLEGLGLSDEALGRSMRDAAIAVQECIDEAGRVLGSQGPTIWARLTPVAGHWPWTQGLVLMMRAGVLVGRSADTTPLRLTPDDR